MPLSEEERRRLEKLEQDLAATDPELNLQLQSGQTPRMAARSVWGVLTALTGFALVIAGIATQVTVIGVIGFVMMGAGAHWLLSVLRPRRGSGYPV